ncbi:kinase-like domain-containing protein [Xylaria flabelliformis]|nr:kinase-like domain-containing protein [Xylaria flabelliformis]
MDQVFATLTPFNVDAKVAFSEVFDAATCDRQGAPTNAAAYRMSVEAEQQYDAAVLRFRREMEKGSSGGDSESLTELNSDTELDMKQLGMLWKGHYVFDLRHGPFASEMGWTVGKRSVGGGTSADIILCTIGLAKRQSLNLRSSHARFSFDRDNGVFFIASLTSSSLAKQQIRVNGEVISRRMHALNQYSMKILIDTLEYIFQYTDFASTEDFVKSRKVYLTTNLNASPYRTFDMPTPRRNLKTFGQWTVNNPLGRGSVGSVFLASNSKNEVVAVKVMQCSSKPGSAIAIDHEISTCRRLTTLAQEQGDSGRVVKLKEVFDPREQPSSSSADPMEFALVLEPMTPLTLDQLLTSERGPRGMSMEAATILREALLGLKFLHDNDWIHKDIKPQNIGVIRSNPPRAVILDVGQAVFLASGATLEATPGFGGTVGYLAPEREMTRYDKGADIWSMGVVALELTYGRNLFKFARNPWRPGAEYEKVRPDFHQRYQEAVHKLSKDYRQCVSQKTNPSFVHRKCQFVVADRSTY